MSVMEDLEATLALWDWRGRMFELYRAVRSLEPAEAWSRWCATRDAMFASHPQTPLAPARREGFRGLPYFPYDSGLRHAVSLDPAGGATVAMEAGRDGAVSLRPFARTRGLAAPLGGELTLYWIEAYGGGVFLPFRDATSGDETFAGGRYLLDTIKGADLGRGEGRAILDFNFAYNPSCAYSERWTCPLAPPGNRLPAPVRAGERRPDEPG